MADIAASALTKALRKTFANRERDFTLEQFEQVMNFDEDIAATTAANLSVSSIPFSQSTDDQIVGELTMQRDILQARLIKKKAEEQK